MSYVRVLVNDTNVTKHISSISALREWNDESVHFSGVFRRGNLQLALDNNNGRFNNGSPLFPEGRNNAEVEISYIANDPKLDPYLIFKGIIDEGSTENNLEIRNINITVLDYLKLLDNEVLRDGDQVDIDALYRRLIGSDIRLNKHFVACFLFFFLRKNNFRLNNIFNVFLDNQLSLSSYPSINASIESIFPCADSYYSANNVSALQILSELCRSMNSYLYVENLKTKTQLFIKARVLSQQTRKNVSNTDILSFFNQTDGFNKLYNSITINGSRAYVDQKSINSYGVRTLNITSYAPASEQLAQSYLDYYSAPKIEISMTVKLSHRTLDLKIGDCININYPSLRNFTVSGLENQSFFIMSRSINFNKDVMSFRLREI